MRLDSLPVRPALQERFDSMVDFRRDLHRHPELAFQESRTAEKVVELLAPSGLSLRTGIAKTGIATLVEGRAEQRTILFRADMDGLPIQEENAADYASRNENVMHACGHDGHTAMLLAASRYLVQHRDFDGTVYVISSLPKRVSLAPRK